MNLRSYFYCCLLALLLGGTAHAQGLRKAVGEPLQAAQQLIQNKQYVEALDKVDDAEKVGKITEYEASVIQRMRAAAAIGAGQHGVALAAYEQLFEGGQLEEAEKPQMLETAVRLAYGTKAYDKVARHVAQYEAVGGDRPEILDLGPQALYLADDCPQAVVAIRARISVAESTGKKPGQTLLQLLTSCALKQDDMAVYTEGLEHLVRHYPTPDFWLDLIARATSVPGFPEQQLALDIYRLRKATGTLGQSNAYVEATQLALQAGYPGEAQAYLDEGYALQLLGSGPDAQRHQQLRQSVAAKVAEDRKTLDAGVVEAGKQSSGDALVAMGLNYAGYGESAKAAELIRAGIAKGQLKNPVLVQLHLGYVLFQGGDVAQASEVFAQVEDVAGARVLARLWSIQAGVKR